MADEIRQLPPDQVIQELGRLFMADAHDRHVYCVFGPYSRLRPFQKGIGEQARRGDFNGTIGRVEYLSLNHEIPEHMKTLGTREKAESLARSGQTVQFSRLLSEAFRDLLTRRIEASGTVGLILSDFELLYAYDQGGQDLSFVRQVAINGKRICLLVPGSMRDGRLWIFDEDPESRREFPDPLVFKYSGWVFELVGEVP